MDYVYSQIVELQILLTGSVYLVKPPFYVAGSVEDNLVKNTSY